MLVCHELRHHAAPPGGCRATRRAIAGAARHLDGLIGAQCGKRGSDATTLDICITTPLSNALQGSQPLLP
jgi:hypothetical protein